MLKKSCTACPTLLFVIYKVMTMLLSIFKCITALQVADMSVTPLTISYERQQVIDFTKPYQDLGLLIMMSQETIQNDLMAFLNPFEWNLWYAVLAAFIVSAVATTICR